MHRILNLGAGTQSSVLLLMAERGELPPVDVAIFSDTGWEPKEVYDHLEWLKARCTKTKIVTVSNGNIYEDAMRSQVRGEKNEEGRWASMPYYVKNEGKESAGQIRRQCTNEYKITPIVKYIKRELLGIEKGKRAPKEVVVDQIFGISFDERQRMRRSTERWATFSYPLIEMGWRRQRVIQWAEENYPSKTFPRSACIGCPFHSNAEWQRVKDGPADEWESVVKLDEAIRHADGMNGEVFLHRSMLPIVDIDFRSRSEKNGQMDLFENECTGMCGT